MLSAPSHVLPPVKSLCSKLLHSLLVSKERNRYTAHWYLVCVVIAVFGKLPNVERNVLFFLNNHFSLFYAVFKEKIYIYNGRSKKSAPPPKKNMGFVTLTLQNLFVCYTCCRD